jgi:type II secretory pathway pseudopilin PulG
VRSAPNRSSGAFTLLELVVVFVIIGILAVLMIPVLSGMRARAQRVQCTANLRSLYVAANLYVQQNGNWPQIHDTDDSEAADKESAKAWIAALAPFGPTQKTWICPTIQSLLLTPDMSNPENVRVDYSATSFDDKPTTPYQWASQPWFIETGNVHGNGNLIVFSDGSISDINTVAHGAAAH